MRIKILGTRGEIRASHARHAKHSGVLIDDKILLDIGEREFLHYHPEIVFVTHLHPDHAYFKRSGEKVPQHLPVYSPESAIHNETMKIISEPIKYSGYTITPIPVIHSLKVKSVGYLVEKNKKRIFYTGDIAAIEDRYLKKMKRVNVVVTEASFFRKGGLIRKNEHGEIFGHAGVPDLIKIFEKITNHIVFTHFGTWFMKDAAGAIKKIKSLGRNMLKVDVASDGAVFDV